MAVISTALYCNANRAIVVLIALLPAVVLSASMSGECFWFNLTSAPEQLEFSHDQLTAQLNESFIGNCSTDDIVSLSALRPHAQTWLVLVADRLIQGSSNDSVTLRAISNLILTSWPGTVFKCAASPLYDMINKTEIVNGLGGNSYSIERGNSSCLVALHNSSSVILTGLAFQKCVSNDVQPAAVEVVSCRDVYVVRSRFSDNFGPAVAIVNSSTVVSACTFQDNIRFGTVSKSRVFNPLQGSSSMVVAIGDSEPHVVTIADSVFTGNINTQTETDDYARDKGGHGAGLSVTFHHAHGQPVVRITNSTFFQNAARQFGGAVFADVVDTSNMTFEVNGCRFLENAAETVGGGLVVYLGANSTENNITIFNSGFQANLGGMGGAVVVILESQDTVQRTFDAQFIKLSDSLLNESFPVSVPSENFISLDSCTFSSNWARGSGNALILMMRLTVSTSPLPANIKNCTFTKERVLNRNGSLSNSSTNLGLYNRVVGLLRHPTYKAGQYLQRLFAWSDTHCTVLCEKLPVEFGSGETKFQTNSIRSIVVRSAALYVSGKLVVSGNVNTEFDGFNLESYGGGIYLTGRSQIYVTNSSEVVVSDNFAGFGAGIFSLTSLASAQVSVGSGDIFSHRCFIIFSSRQFSYPSAASDSLAKFKFENNTAWKGAAIYTSSMLDCASWWRSRRCEQDYPKSFVFRNNSACDYEGFPSPEECYRKAPLQSRGEPAVCGNQTTRESLDNYGIYCPSVATDSFQEHWLLPPESSADPKMLTFSPGQTIGVEAILVDQNCNPSELNTKLQATPDDVVSFKNVHFEVISVSNLSFVSYSNDYEFSEDEGHDVNVTLQPLVSHFVANDYIQLRVGHCRAGYLPNKTANGHYTCLCLETDDVFQSCVQGGTGIVLKSDFWVTNTTADGDIFYHRCPFGYCKPYCSASESAVYGLGQCCEESVGHRGCFFDSSRPNSLCNTNRTGVLCGSCPSHKGLVHAQWIVDCQDCKHQPGLLVLMAGIPAGLSLLIFFLDIHLPHYVWVFVHYVQVASYLPNSNSDNIFRVLMYLQFYTSLDFLFGACIFESMDALQNSALFFVPLGAVTATLVVTYAICWLALKKRRRMWMRRFIHTFLTCFQLMYLNMWLGAYRTLFCADIKFSSGTQKRLLNDGNVLCWQDRHLKYALPVALFAGLILVPAPFLLTLYNTMSLASPAKSTRKAWFGYKEGVGAVWWFSWDMIRKAAVVTGNGIYDVSLHQSIRFIMFAADLTLTCLASIRYSADVENKRGWWLTNHHSYIQSFSLVLLSVLQLLWVAFFITSSDPDLPIVMLSVMETLPIVSLAVWILWNVVRIVCRHIFKSQLETSAQQEDAWSDLALSTSVPREPLRDRFIRTIAYGPIRSYSRGAGRVDEDGYLQPIGSDVLLAGRTPDYHRLRKKKPKHLHNISDSDSDDADDEQGK
ncbi:uncharacterized protein LOC135818190 [Sycon ciliatum]|uniref:uncharacterized protein LOC135818190 n=1 Tax=Sycon ciliatum TaxID=27933 RepID=UPI0031F63FAE